MTTKELENERILVCMAALDRNACDTLISRYKIYSDKMGDPRNEMLFAVISAMHRDNLQVDLKTLVDYLSRGNNVGKAGGAAYISETLDEIGSAANLDYYAKNFVMYWKIRYADNALMKFSESTKADPANISGHIEKLNEAMRIIGEEDTSLDILDGEAMKATLLKDLEFNIAHRGKMIGVPCGIQRIDSLTRGFRAGELIVLAAVSGGGKSAMADFWMMNMIRAGKRVGFYSLEMSREQVLERLASLCSGVPLWRIRSGEISESEKNAMTTNASFLSGSFFMADTPLMDINELKASMRQLAYVNRIDIAVIDYAQLVHAEAGNRKGYEVLTEIADGLKALAKELSIPIVALSQINSRGYDDTPDMGDLGGGLAFTKASDYIFILYPDKNAKTVREKKEKGKKVVDKNGMPVMETVVDENARIINMAKARQCDKKATRLEFLPDTLSFYEKTMPKE